LALGLAGYLLRHNPETSGFDAQIVCCDSTVPTSATAQTSVLLDKLRVYKTISIKKYFTFKGNYFSMIEVLTSFYRLLMPIRPWIVFLLKVDIDPNALDQDNGSSIFPAVLCVSYILFKINHIYSSYLELSQVIVNIYNEQVI
jgi:hypothetical protein